MRATIDPTTELSARVDPSTPERSSPFAPPRSRQGTYRESMLIRSLGSARDLSTTLELRVGSIHSERDLVRVTGEESLGTSGNSVKSVRGLGLETALILEEEGQDAPPPPKPCVDFVLVDSMLALALCGQVGVLCRWGFGKLEGFGEICYGPTCPTQHVWVPNAWVAAFDVLPANMVGCFIMGFLSDGKVPGAALARQLEDGERAQADVERVSALPLAIAPGLDKATGVAALLLGLRTGFCGSLTSFSSYTNWLVTQRVAHAQWGSMFVGYAFGLLLPVSCYRAGQQAALYIAMLGESCALHALPTAVAGWCSKRAAFVRAAALAVILAEIILLILQVFVFTPESSPSPKPLFALLFAPFGVWGRWRLGLLNGRIKTFPIGTFGANMIASALVALISGITGTYTLEPWVAYVLSSFTDGFCGCLSTVSTFIAEVADKLPPISRAGSGNAIIGSGVFYALASVVGGFICGAIFYLPWTA